MKQDEFVWVKWFDACLSTEWKSPENHKDGLLCEAVGFVVKETVESLCIGLQKDGDGDFKDVLSIPKILIQKRKLLK